MKVPRMVEPSPSEPALSEILDASSQPAIACHADTLRVTYANAAAGRLLGCHAADLLQRELERICPSLVTFMAPWQASESSTDAGESQAATIHHIASDGSRLPLVASWESIAVAGQRMVVIRFSRLVETASEENTEAEAALRESERAMAMLMENLPGMVYRCGNTPGWPIEFVGPGAQDLTGFAPADFVEKRVSYNDLIHPDDRQRLWDEVQDALNEGRRFEVTYRITDASGKLKHCWERGGAVLDADGQVTALEGFIADISVIRSLEDQLRQSQKLEALGRLAAGVAHDFSNLLTVMTGYGHLLLRRLPTGESTRGMVQEIVKAGQQATTLTRQLLAFGRQQPVASRVVSLNDCIRDTAKLLQRLATPAHPLRLELEPRLRPICVDPRQIEQVLMNLVTNARDASPRGGAITVATRMVSTATSRLDDRFHQVSRLWVELSVRDCGRGMDQETQSRIFEPFFTTKHAGEGTGLGLATVHGIVEKHQARIEVESEPGRGTAIRICFPPADDEPSTSNSVDRYDEVRGGTETVLIVEDDPQVLKLIEHSLQAYGYEVLAASTAREALDIHAQEHRRIQAVVTDIHMLEMSGLQLAEHLPDVNVLFMSASPDPADLSGSTNTPARPYLQKPFTSAELARKLREILDAR
jgi:PAS domain S-box-containing protein